jgi:hypothetical protein
MFALRPAAALATALFLVTLSTGAAGQGVRPGTAEGGELVKTGWWWAGNETPLDETVIAPPQSSPPNVPKGALPVAAAGGEPEKLSALEFRVKGDPGDRVDSARLVLKENAEPGATVNAERAVILACPVTESFWADGSAGAWKTRPAYDCEVAGAKGERDPAGLWTFDLTAIAASWLLDDNTTSPSVVLVEGVQSVDSAVAPESFQVSFDGPAAEGIGFEFVTTAVPPVPMPSEPSAPPSGPVAGDDAPASGGAPRRTGGGGRGRRSPGGDGRDRTRDRTRGRAAGGAGVVLRHSPWRLPSLPARAGAGIPADARARP